MYHYITLGDAKIYMTGVGILLFVIFFLFITYTYTKKHRLNFQKFSHRLPAYLLFLYLLSQYSRYLIEQHTIIPTTLSQVLLYLSPYGYPFHVVGIILGIIAIRRHFQRYVEPDERKQILRLDTFYHAITLGCIPLGMFLLLGDNFIGQATETSLYVSAIRSDSAMAVYGKVLPLGSFLAFLGLIAHLGHTLLARGKKAHEKYIYLFYALFCGGLALVLMFQQYPRHIVSSVGNITLDIKQYLLFIVAAYFIRKQVYSNATQ